MRKLFDKVSKEAATLVDAFAVSVPEEHEFMIVVRRRQSNKLYLKSSANAQDALTLLAIMDVMGGSFRVHAEQIVKEIEADAGRNG